MLVSTKINSHEIRKINTNILPKSKNFAVKYRPQISFQRKSSNKVILKRDYVFILQLFNRFLTFVKHSVLGSFLKRHWYIFFCAMPLVNWNLLKIFKKKKTNFNEVHYYSLCRIVGTRIFGQSLQILWVTELELRKNFISNY